MKFWKQSRELRAWLDAWDDGWGWSGVDGLTCWHDAQRIGWSVKEQDDGTFKIHAISPITFKQLMATVLVLCDPYEAVSNEHVITPDGLRELLADWDAHPGWAAANDETPFFLWGGKLTAEQVREIVERNARSTVGRHVFSDAQYGAIADELNATLGGGECEMVPLEPNEYATNAVRCSKCNAIVATSDDAYECCEIRFCPNCGKAVER